MVEPRSFIFLDREIATSSLFLSTTDFPGHVCSNHLQKEAEAEILKRIEIDTFDMINLEDITTKPTSSI